MYKLLDILNEMHAHYNFEMIKHANKHISKDFYIKSTQVYD